MPPAQAVHAGHGAVALDDAAFPLFGVPEFEPLARSVNMDPVHFAMVGIISLAFGLVTPPYGLCLMISCAIAKVRMVYVLKDVMIMLLPMLGVLALAIIAPDVIWPFNTR